MNFQKDPSREIPSLYRTLKIRLHPSEAQRLILRQWFAAARLFGNQTVSCLNDFRDFDPEDYTYPELRAYVRDIVTTDHPWTASINQQITANAVQASWNDLQTNFAKLLCGSVNGTVSTRTTAGYSYDPNDIVHMRFPQGVGNLAYLARSRAQGP
jgi:hypothetical protein